MSRKEEHPIRYTVKEVSLLSNVTVKTLHHYHKIGLLFPCEITEAGYRLYGMEELERLQQILFYKELDFSLEQIKQLLGDEPDRYAVLSQQEQLLLARQERLRLMLQTLRKSMDSAKKGEKMHKEELFRGLNTESECKEAMQEQNEYLKDSYNYDMIDSEPIDVSGLNEQAQEATAFMNQMAKALKSGEKHNSEEVQQLIRDHIEFLSKHGHAMSAEDFAVQTRFFLKDEFHLRMLEGQQTGLAYYLTAAAESYATNV